MYTKLIGAVGTLHDLMQTPVPILRSDALTPEEKCSTTYSYPPGRSIRGKESKHTARTGRTYAKKFNVYKPTPLPEQEYRQQIEDDGSSRWRMESWNDFRSRKVNSLIIGMALREMNRLHREGQEWTREQIEETCFSNLDRAFFERHELEYPTDSYTAAMDGDNKVYQWDSVERTLQSAVEYAAEVWDSQIDAEMRKRASDAGKAFSLFDNVKDYLTVRGMRKAAAARHLGRSRNTIAKMFAHFEGMTDDELEALRIEQERKTHGHQSQEPHPSDGEASALRIGAGEEVESRPLRLARDVVSGRDGSTVHPCSSEDLDGKYRRTELLPVTLPF